MIPPPPSAADTTTVGAVALERGEGEGGGPSLPLLNEAEEAWDLQDVSFFPSPSLSVAALCLAVMCTYIHALIRGDRCGRRGGTDFME